MTPTEPKQEPQSNAVGPQKSDMTPTWGFSVSGDAGTRLASAFFPLLLFVGTAVAFFGEFHLPIWPVILGALCLPLVLLSSLLHDGRWTLQDARWAWVPVLVMITSYADPTWMGPMLSDQSDHLQTANRYLGRWDWEPYHMDQDFAFRPKVVSGLAAVELAMTGAVSRVHAVPLMLLIGCGWQAQRLAEEAGAGRWALLAPLACAQPPLHDATGSDRLPRGVGHGRGHARAPARAKSAQSATPVMDRNRAWLDPRCGRLGQISIPVPWSLHGHHRSHQASLHQARRVGFAWLDRASGSVRFERFFRSRSRRSEPQPTNDWGRGKHCWRRRHIQFNPSL